MCRTSSLRFSSLALVALVAVATGLPASQGSPQQDLIDPVTELRQQIVSGEVTLDFDSVTGYLPALLAALDIPISSQTLVFSRTSLQTDLIAPWSPRAVYFNDDVYVGYVADSPFLEIAAVDPDSGSVFYTLNQNPSVIGLNEEDTTCLMCHDSRTVTGGVQGVMVRSVIPDRFGYPITTFERGATTDRTLMENKLGGWYVTGSFGTPHAGNRYVEQLSHEVSDKPRFVREYQRSVEMRVDSLTDRFDTTPYLTPHSDVVAILVLVHQTRLHNLITLTHEAVSEALSRQRRIVLSTDVSVADGELLPTTASHIQGAVDRLVDGLLFADAAPLGGPLEGSTDFARDFTARGPHDSHGRSLRNFDLHDRLFEFPLSFLVYSEAFDAIPPVARNMVYRRVAEILTGEPDAEKFAHLTSEIRQAIVEILTETKPEFAELTGLR